MNIFNRVFNKKQETNNQSGDPLSTSDGRKANPSAPDLKVDPASDLPELPEFSGESVLLPVSDDSFVVSDAASAAATSEVKPQTTHSNPEPKNEKKGFWSKLTGKGKSPNLDDPDSLEALLAASAAREREEMEMIARAQEGGSFTSPTLDPHADAVDEVRETQLTDNIRFDGQINDAIIEPEKHAIDDALKMHAVGADREQDIIREIGERPSPLPVIGRMSAKSQYSISIGLLIGSLLIGGTLGGGGFLMSSEFRSKAEVGTKLEMLSQRILATTQYAITGDSDSAEKLKASRDAVAEQLESIVKGSSTHSGMSLEDNEKLKQTDAVLRMELLPLVDQVIALSPALSALNENSKKLQGAAQNMYLSSEQLIVLMQSNGSSEIHISAAEHVRVLSERLRRNGLTLLSSSEIQIEPMTEFSADLSSLKSTIEAMSKGSSTLKVPQVTDVKASEILTSMNTLLKNFDEVSMYVDKNANSIVSLRRNLQEMIKKSELVLQSSGAFAKEMSQNSLGSLNTVYLATVFLALSMLSLLLVGIVSYRITKRDAWESAFKNKLNEKDIIDFMEACMPLEMGDLTVRFNQNLQSMEGITGGIRNSVNEAVISINDAVDSVKKTADSISEVVSTSVQNTTDMKISNERQSAEIADAETRVLGLTSAIEQVSEKSDTAAAAAKSAMSASEHGAEIVSLANKKMSVIRGNMQDVLKSVKHLGETSQEIGDIVVAIEQITDRTQVLAVNASLEAARAGAAGSGFQIIAGEVNRLAEQSADALRSITALVQRVQGETGSTIGIVEESTNNVVEGARMSDEANEQLTRIRALASQLTDLVQDIREQSAIQSSDAKEVKATMERLANLSNQFQDQVSSVVNGVEQIDASMGSLKTTVSIFTTETSETA